MKWKVGDFFWERCNDERQRLGVVIKTDPLLALLVDPIQIDWEDFSGGTVPVGAELLSDNEVEFDLFKIFNGSSSDIEKVRIAFDAVRKTLEILQK